MTRGGRIVIAGLMAVATSCAHQGAALGANQSLPVQLDVINHYALQVDVFAEAGGTSYHVGTVAPGIDSHWVLRRSLLVLGPVQLVAQPRDGGRPFRTQTLQVSAGDTITLEITSTLFNSTASVAHP
ncbi:MAG TPA: hypothetical protein VLD17_01350 [Gemmatimonadaceae bacterium]|nr:hypothetical protein [Gemmatimonadaceae bacterium]